MIGVNSRDLLFQRHKMSRISPSPGAVQGLAATEVEKLQKEAGDAWDKTGWAQILISRP